MSRVCGVADNGVSRVSATCGVADNGVSRVSSQCGVSSLCGVSSQ